MLITVIEAGPAISQSVAKRFGQQGYNVALLARQKSTLND